MRKSFVLIELLLAAVFLFASCGMNGKASGSVGNVAGGESEDLDYIIDKEAGFAKISGRGDCHDAKIVIPKQIKGYPVTGISKDAFRDDVNLTGIVFPESVTSIGESAFYNCSDLMANNFQKRKNERTLFSWLSVPQTFQF